MTHYLMEYADHSIHGICGTTDVVPEDHSILPDCPVCRDVIVKACKEVAEERERQE